MRMKSKSIWNLELLKAFSLRRWPLMTWVWLLLMMVSKICMKWKCHSTLLWVLKRLTCRPLPPWLHKPRKISAETSSINRTTFIRTSSHRKEWERPPSKTIRWLAWWGTRDLASWPEQPNNEPPVQTAGLHRRATCSKLMPVKLISALIRSTRARWASHLMIWVVSIKSVIALLTKVLENSP